MFDQTYYQRMVLKKIYILLLFISSSIFAQSVDLELEVEFESSDNVYLGFVGDFRVTITNNGPDEIDNYFILSPLMNLSGYFLSPDNSLPQLNCLFYFVVAEPRPPYSNGGTTLVIEPTPLSAGESVTCFGLFQVDFEFGTRELTWTARSIGNAIPDPIPENNSVTVILGIPPQQVNALSIISLLLLICTVLVIGLKQRLK